MVTIFKAHNHMKIWIYEEYHTWYIVTNVTNYTSRHYSTWIFWHLKEQFPSFMRGFDPFFFPFLSTSPQILVFRSRTQYVRYALKYALGPFAPKNSNEMLCVGDASTDKTAENDQGSKANTCRRAVDRFGMCPCCRRQTNSLSYSIGSRGIAVAICASSWIHFLFAAWGLTIKSEPWWVLFQIADFILYYHTFLFVQCFVDCLGGLVQGDIPWQSGAAPQQFVHNRQRCPATVQLESNGHGGGARPQSRPQPWKWCWKNSWKKVARVVRVVYDVDFVVAGKSKRNVYIANASNHIIWTMIVWSPKEVFW